MASGFDYAKVIRWSFSTVAGRPRSLVRLLDGPQRFAQLAADIPGVSRRMLTERLRELEAAGIIVRHVDAGPRISVRYALAEQADDLEAALRALKVWAATKAS